MQKGINMISYNKRFLMPCQQMEKNLLELFLYIFNIYFARYPMYIRDRVSRNWPSSDQKRTQIALLANGNKIF